MKNAENAVPTIKDLARLVPEESRAAAESLAAEICFMHDTLERLKAHIAENGPVEWYANGAQQHWRESPAMKAYSALIPRYSGTIKQLLALLPKDAGDDDGDELEQWLRANT